MVANRLSRQNFLGNQSEETFSTVRIGQVGLGGGGSQFAVNFVHLGIKNSELFDPQCVDREGTNLNRTVTAIESDVAAETPKVLAAKRRIMEVRSNASPGAHQKRWEDQAELLRGCDIVVGCGDTFLGRRDLEQFCRRWLIPYVDIGMDVHEAGDEPPRMTGQIIVSLPDGPCMFCMNFLNERNLAKEGTRYGAAGARPQVVWANAILAGHATGLIVDLLTNWTRTKDLCCYYSYDGNIGLLKPHVRWERLNFLGCPHYSAHEVGDPVASSW